MDSNVDELRDVVQRVRRELTAEIQPNPVEVRQMEMDDRASEAFGVALGKLKDAAYALSESVGGGVKRDEAVALIRDACDVLETQILTSWVPASLDAERHTAVRDLSAAVARPY